MKKILLTLCLLFTFVAALPVMAQTAAPVKIVNVNTATREELIALPGIGDAKADAIIEQRQKQPFSKKEDLLMVKGIGDKLLEKMAAYVVVSKEAGAIAGK